MPHGMCYFWDVGLIILHSVSDLLIAISYYIIPIVLLRILKGRNLVGNSSKILNSKWLIWFSAFIFMCGTIHLMEIVTIWKPWYLASGIIKSIAAVISLSSAIFLIREIPYFANLPVKIENLRLKAETKAKIMIEQEVTKNTIRDIEQKLGLANG